MLMKLTLEEGRQIAIRTHREYVLRGLWSVRDEKDRVMRMWVGEAGREAESRPR
jgi:hypothetical protein